MFKHLFPYLQYVLPKHLITKLIGWFAESQNVSIKNFMIHRFIKTYDVDMTQALIKNPESYPSFNSFFIRELDMTLRPIAPGANDIACPVDGTLAQIGKIKERQLLQAKSFYYDLDTLLGGDKALVEAFTNGSFATLYLAPYDYHRVHMPLSGTLTKSMFVPGRLFSVNRMTSDIIPNLYSRNERLITLFDTEAGPVAIILIGALIVGSIQTVWMDKPVSRTERTVETHTIQIAKGDELGFFQLGSTVLLLFADNKANWDLSLKPGAKLKVGQLLGSLKD